VSLNSNAKGKRGELELVHFLEDMGLKARRGQQFQGSPDSPDVVSELEHLHIEVKRCERLSVYKAMWQAIEDAAEGQVPVVAHKRNRQEWLVVLRAEDFFKQCHQPAQKGEMPRVAGPRI
jgi:Holliday junction resolvase